MASCKRERRMCACRHSVPLGACSATSDSAPNMAQGHCRNILQGIESTVAQTQVSDSTASLACSPCLERHSVLSSAVCPDTWPCCHRQRMAAAPVRSQAFSPPVVTRSPSHTTTVSISHISFKHLHASAV